MVEAPSNQQQDDRPQMSYYEQMRPFGAYLLFIFVILWTAVSAQCFQANQTIFALTALVIAVLKFGACVKLLNDHNAFMARNR